ncbi:MAG TPA: hypothetical protein VLF69_03445 [Candidatus Saccharimonadales bacterium]|nr:hypothetical protein [Candidatus Saccharimonadales bacterium]
MAIANQFHESIQEVESGFDRDALVVFAGRVDTWLGPLNVAHIGEVDSVGEQRLVVAGVDPEDVGYAVHRAVVKAGGKGLLLVDMATHPLANTLSAGYRTALNRLIRERRRGGRYLLSAVSMDLIPAAPFDTGQYGRSLRHELPRAIGEVKFLGQVVSPLFIELGEDG